MFQIVFTFQEQALKHVTFQLSESFPIIIVNLI